jgi:GT2 family glycosyltransferase
VRPLVSFIIPVRNDVLRLQRCLRSITRNDYPRQLIDIVVVDNESTDGSAKAARQYGATVVNSSGTSVAAHRNRGARTALGAILAFADSDHEIDGRWIETAVEVLSQPDIAATGAPYVTQPRANWVQQHYDCLRSRSEHREDVAWLGSGNLAVKRSVFEAIGGFNTSLIACEDVDLCNRISAAGHRIVADPRLRSIHFGDPKTLKALFFGELWRGRNNLRVTLNGPRTFRHLRSALVAVVDLICLIGVALAVATAHFGIATVFGLAAFVPAALRAARMLARQPRDARTAAQALVVAMVFDLARALAIVVRGTHRARRTA